jgi:hypothetical protein
MSHRDHRHVETLAGRGWISLDGVRLSDVTYHIDVWQQFVNASHRDSVPATRQYAGRVSDHELGRFDLFDRLVRLHFENGGHLDCELHGNRVIAAGVLFHGQH